MLSDLKEDLKFYFRYNFVERKFYWFFTTIALVLIIVGIYFMSYSLEFAKRNTKVFYFGYYGDKYYFSMNSKYSEELTVDFDINDSRDVNIFVFSLQGYDSNTIDITDGNKNIISYESLQFGDCVNVKNYNIVGYKKCIQCEKAILISKR